jgi:hypothetical protein
MSNRQYILAIIPELATRIKNAASRDERFTHLDNVAMLGQILEDVVNFENSLITDLDVD